MEICQQATNVKKSKLPYLQYCMHRINMLRYYNVIPVVVFDGGRLPSKASTEEERQRKRADNLEQARAKLSEGDVNGAIELFQRAVEITPFMAHELIQILKSEGIEFVVAPYEADAQLAYLARLDPEKGGIAAVISEDSDLMAYSCNVVIYKMDRSGDGEEVVLDKVFNIKTLPPGALPFRCFTPELFTGMCVLAGCDFLPSVPGIGIKRAHALVSKYRSLDRVLSILQFEKHHCIPEDYASSFKAANAVFHYSRIYDADLRSLAFLQPLPEELWESFDGDLSFLGPDMPPSKAAAIAEGLLDPITMEAFDAFPNFSVSDGDQIICRDEKDVSEQQQLNWQSEEEASPFVIFSQQSKDNFWTGNEEKHSEEVAFIGHKNRVNKEQEFMVCKVASETECVIPSQKAAELDRGFMAQLRAMAENSSTNALALSVDHGASYHPMCDNGGVLDAKGQKRIFPPAPDNNPFKKKRLEDSSSPGQGSKMSSFQKAPHCASTSSIGETITQTNPEDIASTSLKVRNTKASNEPDLFIPSINEQETTNSNPSLDGPDSTPAMQHSLPEFTAQSRSGTVCGQISGTSVLALKCPATSSQKNLSSAIQGKAVTKNKKNNSKNIARSSSGIMKFFPKI